MSTTVLYKDTSIVTVEALDTITLKTAGKYLEDDITLSSSLNLQSKSVEPRTSQFSIHPDEGYEGLGSVTIAAMPSGTAGTPTATKGSVSNHAVTVTPSVTNTTGYITGGTKTGTAVTVTASELVSGTKSITENGTGIDVTNYASVDVNVSGGVDMPTFTAIYSDDWTEIKSTTCDKSLSECMNWIRSERGRGFLLISKNESNTEEYWCILGGEIIGSGVDFIRCTGTQGGLPIVEVEYKSTGITLLDNANEFDIFRTLNITSNGTYTADLSLYAYKEIIVNTPSYVNGDNLAYGGE